LQQIDQRKLVVQPYESWIEDIKLVANQMMECHSRVLRCALDQPIQRQPLVDFITQPVVVHRRPCAFGSGVGRVWGQSGLNGSSLRRGSGGISRR
jgi:hypothetical protein